MTLVIHITRQQVALIAATPGISKLHIEQDGTKSLIVPHWIGVMWKYAKVHEFREAVSQQRMISHPYVKDNHNLYKRIFT